MFSSRSMAYKLLVRFSSFHFAQPGVRLKGNYLKPKFSSPVRSVSSVKVEDATNRLVIRWKDNISDAFPHMWLRDNCQCSSCYNSSTQSRTINMQDFQMNHTPKSAVSWTIAAFCMLRIKFHFCCRNWEMIKLKWSGKMITRACITWNGLKKGVFAKKLKARGWNWWTLLIKRGTLKLIRIVLF